MPMVSVNILSGFNCIGGCFVRIEDGDRILVFDQGLRFDVMSSFYSWLITPRGIAELRRLGAVPKPEWYENVCSIYVTHMHLDHLGLLSNIPRESSVYLPDLDVYGDMEEKWLSSPTWLSLVPGKYYLENEEVRPLEVDRNGVTAIPVSHSAYPSYALMYHGRDETILYTGDFRVEGFLPIEEFRKLRGGVDLLSYLNENPDLRVDKLVIEGTNIGSSRVPLAPREALDVTRRLLSSARPLIATVHWLDLEYAYKVVELAGDLELECYVASEQIAKLLERLPRRDVKPVLIEEYVKYPSLLEKTSIEDLDPHSIILSSYREIVDLLRDLAPEKTGWHPTAVLSEPEPEREEAVEYGVVANWFRILGVQYYRVRASGHYYPYQLKTIIETIKPKEIIPIHTLYPKYLRNLANLV